jgi:hypothetical protein
MIGCACPGFERDIFIRLLHSMRRKLQQFSRMSGRRIPFGTRRMASVDKLQAESDQSD